MGFEFPLQGSLTSTFLEHDQHVAFVRAHALGSGGLNLIEVCGQGLKVQHVLLRAGRVFIHDHSSQPWVDFSKRPLGTPGSTTRLGARGTGAQIACVRRARWLLKRHVVFKICAFKTKTRERMWGRFSQSGGNAWMFLHERIFWKRVIQKRFYS